MQNQAEKIRQLKKEHNAVIMAHYYVNPEIQQIADYVGDSYYLSEQAAKVQADIIVLCGVCFMGESAKVLNPEKKVLLPDQTADCPMAHMVSVSQIKKVRAQHPGAAVVCYVNSTAEIKAHSDVCVTSSNALEIVRKMPEPVIYFIPDQHLGRFVAAHVPEKEFIFHQGCCPVHDAITVDSVMKAKAAHPAAEVVVHPECRAEVVKLADYAGSTSGIIAYVKNSKAREFIVCTETGILHELKKISPSRRFYLANEHQICPDMKKITMDKVIAVLERGGPEVVLDPELIRAVKQPLEKMLELAK